MIDLVHPAEISVLELQRWDSLSRVIDRTGQQSGLPSEHPEHRRSSSTPTEDI